MNRIALCDVPLPHSYSTQQLSPNHDSDASSERIDHSIFVPLHYESNYSYPVIIWLHGPADDQGQLKKIMPHVSMRNYLGISPCGTEAISDVAEGDDYLGYTWRQDSEQISDAQTRVFACVQKVKERFNIRESKIFLAGYDEGGTMALRLALLHPEMFAGAASICGGLPEGLSPFLRINEARSLPILLAHGRDSEEYSVDHVCQDLRLLHAGGIKVSIRQYPCEQEVTTPMLNDLNRWMMEITTGQQADADQRNSSSLSDHN